MKFASTVLLSKREAFEACEACAEGERALLRSGKVFEAGRLAALFELIEERLVDELDRARPSYRPSGSKSSDNEFTQ